MKKKLSDMRIMLVNDDGYGAPGIKTLEKIACALSDDVWIVAPAGNRSGKGHSVTFDMPLRISQVAPKKFLTTGTPVDCVIVGVQHVLKDKKPDLILSGINYGGNFADFIVLSGTVNAALAGVTMGIPSIAISHEFDKDGKVNHEVSEKLLPSILQKLVDIKWPADTVINVNFPDSSLEQIKHLKIAKQGRLKLSWQAIEKFDPVNDPYYWMRALHENGDLDKNCELTILKERDSVTITPLKPQYTNFDSMSLFEDEFKDFSF